jgi:hypothetical protein
LLDRSKPDDREELKRKLKMSSCVILCIPGDALANFVQGSSKLPDGVGQFNALIKNFREETGKTVPIVISITKSDLCIGDNFIKGIDAITKRMLPTLFAPNSGWTVMICPVSLGKDKSSGFEIQPINVHLPVTFAIFTALQNDIDKTQKAINSHQNTIKEKESEVNRLGRNVWSAFWNSSDIAAEQYAIDELEETTGLRQSECETLQKDLNLLKKELFGTNLYIYYGGRRISLEGS